MSTEGKPPSGAPRPARRIGALTLLAACFVASAAVRLAEVGPATAQALFPPEGFEVRATDEAEGDAADPLLAALRERSEQIAVREQQLAERAAALELAERELEEQRQALIAAEERLAATVATADGAAERDVAQLTAIYENVKPKRAAGVFGRMDETFAAGILARMTPATAGEILTLMPAEKAYAISVLMAARNMNAGGPLPDTDPAPRPE